MSFAFIELERIEARVLGALRCIDAITGVPIDGLLTVTATPATVQRNRSGLFVIREWAPLADHTASFAAPPASPAIGSQLLDISVEDPSGRYLPRRAQLALPRDPDPAGLANAGSLFQPALLSLYPSAIAPTGANWSVLRVSLVEAASQDALGGALLKVISGGKVLARGLTDWRGEGLLPVAGVPVTSFSNAPDAPVVTSSIKVTLQAIFDPAAGTRTAAAQVLDGRAPDLLPLVDPDDLEARASSLKRVQRSPTIAARQTLAIKLDLAL